MDSQTLFEALRSAKSLPPKSDGKADDTSTRPTTNRKTDNRVTRDVKSPEYQTALIHAVNEDSGIPIFSLSAGESPNLSQARDHHPDQEIEL